MGVGAVPDIGEDVALAGERLLAEPHRAFAAHVRDGRRLHRVHQHRHGVAADAGERPAALGYAGRAVVRTAGAEAGASYGRGSVGERFRRRGGSAEGASRVALAQRSRQHLRDEFRRRLAVIRDGLRAVGRIEGRSVEILADDARRVHRSVEDRADLIFEQRTLLFDDDDEIESAGEVAHRDGVERPYHPDLEEAQAERGALVGKAEIAERLQNILPRLAGGDDADAGVRTVDGDAVQLIGAGVGERGRELVVVEPLLLHERHVDHAGAETARRLARPLGDDDRGRVRDRHRPCRRLRRRR